jgi:hypothetical protein
MFLSLLFFVSLCDTEIIYSFNYYLKFFKWEKHNFLVKLDTILVDPFWNFIIL